MEMQEQPPTHHSSLRLQSTIARMNRRTVSVACCQRPAWRFARSCRNRTYSIQHKKIDWCSCSRPARHKIARCVPCAAFLLLVVLLLLHQTMPAQDHSTPFQNKNSYLQWQLPAFDKMLPGKTGPCCKR